jgi:threonine aldolase
MSSFRVDLRSDTVTKPSEAMRRAMAEAEVGDDWYDDDPTVNLLQERCAELVGKEAGAFVPTGTMANQIGLRLHFTGPGHLVAAAAGLHVTSVEVMTAAALAGIAYRTVDAGARGWIDADQAAQLLEPDEFYDVEVIDLLSVENTVGGAGGRVMPLEELRAVRKVANGATVPIHLDGARIFNAAAAAEVDAADIAAEVDTVMFCLSKGLGAPIGSVLCGPADMAREARRLKILYGGAWRQAGIVAAAGLIALEEGPKRLSEDHERARRLAEGVAEALPGSVELDQVETNMVLVDTEAVGMAMLETIERLAALGVGVTHSGGKIRMVTHLDVDDAGIETALNAWRDLAADRTEEGHRT